MVGNGRKGNGRRRTSQSSTGGWEIIYTGFILILLCFFIMLCSFSSVKKSKVQKFVNSFTESLDILKGGSGFHPAGDIPDPSADITVQQSDLRPIFEKLVMITNDHGLQDEVALSFSPGGLVMRLSDRALFDLGVAEVSPRAIPLLDKIGVVISQTPNAVRIEGHTDNLPIHTARFPSNWELSTARAVRVLRHFMEAGRIPAQRLSASGFGEFQPIFPNDTPEQRSKNRRVEIIFASEESANSSGRVGK